MNSPLRKFIILFSILIVDCYHCPQIYSLSTATREMLEPYLLPLDHPIKLKLDKIFVDPHVLDSEKTLKQKGFDLSKSQKQLNHVKVCSHKKLKNYLVKTYTNDQIVSDEYLPYIKRIVNAKHVQVAIERLNLQKIFKVPNKWIYVLPQSNVLTNKLQCILVVEDMKLYSNGKNKSMWKDSAHATKRKLFALYTLLSEEGLIGCIYLDNIPFARDRRIAIIDTEHAHIWPVKLHRLTNKLPLDLQEYWLNLIN